MMSKVIVKIQPGRAGREEASQWQRVGKAHFLSQFEFKAARRHRVPGPEHGGGQAMRLLLDLAILLAPFYALYQATMWLCPLAIDIPRWLVRKTNDLARPVIRKAIKLSWTDQIREWGTMTTIWFWLIAVALISTLAAMITWELAWLSIAVLIWTLVVSIWWILRWRAQRRYRPHVLPARRERR